MTTKGENIKLENYIYNLFGMIEKIPQYYLYLFTFFSGLMQVVFPPYPGELVIVMAGCVEAKKQVVEGLMLFFTYWAAIVTANYMLYEFGRRKGEAVLNNRFVGRFITQDNREKIKVWLSRFGLFVFLIAIYVPGLYLPVVYFSGVMKIKRYRAFPGIMIATAIHDILLFFGGRYAGNNLAHITAFLSVYKNAAMCIAGSLILLYTAYMVIKYLRKRQVVRS